MNQFKLKVTYVTGYADIDTKGVLTQALQKKYSGYQDKVFLYETISYGPLSLYKINSFIKLRVFSSKYEEEVYTVTYNDDPQEPKDAEVDILEYVIESIKCITYYKYRSVHSMDTVQKVDISIIKVEKTI